MSNEIKTIPVNKSEDGRFVVRAVWNLKGGGNDAGEAYKLTDARGCPLTFTAPALYTVTEQVTHVRVRKEGDGLDRDPRRRTGPLEP